MAKVLLRLAGERGSKCSCCGPKKVDTAVVFDAHVASPSVQAKQKTFKTNPPSKKEKRIEAEKKVPVSVILDLQ